MTAQPTERLDPQPQKNATTRSSGRAYDRRSRRQQAVTGRSLTRTGSPIAAALHRLPFVAMIILLLAGGIVGVLWLNTMTDAAGLRAGQSRVNQNEINTQIEARNKAIAALKNPSRLAAEASSLGLVPPGDAAMLQIGADGQATVIGSPTPVAAPTTAPATAAATTAATTTAPATTVPATTRPSTTTARAATRPKATAHAKVTVPVKAAPPAAPKPTTGPVANPTAAKSASHPAATHTTAPVTHPTAPVTHATAIHPTAPATHTAASPTRQTTSTTGAGR